MDWLINLLLGFAVGYLIAEGVKSLLLGYLERKKRQEFQEDVTHAVEGLIAQAVKVHVREENGVFYAYDAFTDEFYAQGNSIPSLVVNLHANTKKEKLVFVSSDEGAKQPLIDYLTEKLGKTPQTVGL
jgi:hypothetical protein